MSEVTVKREAPVNRPPNAGKGRPKGARNKTTALLKDAILKAAEQAGNKVGDEGLVSYLVDIAKREPKAFVTLLGKVLPMQVEGTGADGSIGITFKTIIEK